MKNLKFKCTLLSDVILNRKTATEGNNNTLDFIPGNTFLGIVARHYAEFGEEAMEVFHSGKVRFGDAHPIGAAEGQEPMRTLRVPASLYYPKMKSAADICYVHHLYDRSKDKADGGQPQQLKQCRNGFYAFCDGKGTPATVDRSFSIKSAYDREKRRSEDEKMFGYEALDKGSSFLFSVETDRDSLADRIRQKLVGEHTIGRSRTAQYGLVRIEECDFTEMPSHAGTTADGLVAVYADSRLIFLDGCGEPTFRPEASDLGLTAGEIDWEKSQVRTFQYAPWNGKRATRDAERCGIEKGSVFIVRGAEAPSESQYVGVYRNEGFGRVIYNPDFLEASGTNGEARYRLTEAGGSETAKDGQDKSLSGTPLLDYVARMQKQDAAERYIYKKVNEFVTEHTRIFRGVAFASQWGTIRQTAMQQRTYETIRFELFDKTETKTSGKDNQRKTVPAAYLTHGVAEEQWKKKSRRSVLEKFVEDIHSQENRNKYGDITAQALVNLASEMAKQCRR